ncbi:2-oxoacid dehydrogenases acyltransferase-domain-containing protein [Cantharellus anzutake]|uniref:2-oxoacid dehydrogenases acyltransferase-domain-containing protein n=1 Tax=Cantharellus anzutake TaxID=1750568 RepID=UPI00190799A9|nr:2-oxoacid dehydrogenases acyltransferase-domain-containing protein [Cantharellus anzutake]KAF8338320.1 2-oxoacid dehydrogenases acyltransferase-domain-containing protein [Cantharellus anzutake]
MLARSVPFSLMSRSLFPFGRISAVPIYGGWRLLHSSLLWHAKTLRPFLLADIGEGITECEVLKWSIRPNAKVEAFDALCEVQSDKASVEITSPFSGTVKQLLVQEGEIAKVGQGLCIIEVDEDGVDDSTSSDPVAREHVDTISVTTDTNDASPSSDYSQPSPAIEEPLVRPRRHHPLDPSKPPSSPSKLSSHPQIISSLSTHFAPAPNTLAAPSVRHLARKSGIEDISVIKGTGRNGRIEKVDVERYLSQGIEKVNAFPTAGASPASGQVQMLELGRTRWAMYKAMTKSLEIPHFGYSSILDLTEIHNSLPILNAHIPLAFNPPPPSKHAPLVSPDAIFPPSQPIQQQSSSHDATLWQFNKLTYLPFLLKTLSRAMLEWPIFRTTISHTQSSSASSSSPASPPKPMLALRPHADISLALSTPTGLYTPTIQAVERLSTYEIAGEIKRLTELGRRIPSALSRNEMPPNGGTITVSNVGAVGRGEFASPVLVPGGGVAIVAIGRAKWVMREGEQPGQAQRRLQVGISWSADHRVVEGAEMAAFVETWRSWVENPQRLIAEAR